MVFKLMINQSIKKIADKHDILSIYLFGSQAEAGIRYMGGETVIPETHSDLDVAVAFEKPPADVIRQYGMLYQEFSDIFDPFNLDLIFMQEVNALFQYEILKGIRIYEKNIESVDEFEERIMKRAADLQFTKKALDKEIMEAIEDGYIEFEYSPNS